MTRIVADKSYILIMKNKKGGFMFLERLGIYGMGEVEDFILASLVTGDPLLLVGEVGSAKTLLSKRIAESLGLKFHAYDASKALFEDVIGFPNPQGFERGEIEYVPTPISIWDKEFVLIDEISRAEPQMQNKWLEVIRERKIMGLKLKNLKYIFGAMNPPEYLGTNYLDEAFAGRFSFIIEVPSIKKMSESEMKRIIETISDEDAPMIKRENKNTRYESLRKFIEKCREDFIKIKEEFGEKVKEYIVYLLEEVKNSDIFIDGRRAGMIYRNILSVISVKLNKGKFKKENLPAIFYKTVLLSLPFKVTGEKFNTELFVLAHSEVMRKIQGKGFIELSKINTFYQEDTLSKLLNAVESSASIQKRTSNTCALIFFIIEVLSGKIKTQKSFLSTCLRIFVERTFSPNLPEDYDFIFRSQEPPDLNEICDSLSLRLTFYECQHLKKGYLFPKITDEIQEVFYNYKKILKENFKKGEI